MALKKYIDPANNQAEAVTPSAVGSPSPQPAIPAIADPPVPKVPEPEAPDPQPLSPLMDSPFRYLAIGNSITYHGAASYWWNPGVGMAASSREKDYVHVLTNLIRNGIAENTTATSTNFSIWELLSYDRAETFPLLDKYLSSDLDLVTIQLGENVQDSTTLESDFEDLINYIKEKAPSAKIILVGEFWADVAKDTIKKTAAQKTNVAFVDLSPMWGYTIYQAGLGTKVEGADGSIHEITHAGVASHPGDLGMDRIAHRIYRVVRQFDFTS